MKQEFPLTKVMEIYFDSVFKDIKFKTINKWYGIYNINNRLIVGHPSDNNSTWYSNGEFFNPDWEMFGIGPVEFNKYMKNYLNNKFNISIKSLW